MTRCSSRARLAAPHARTRTAVSTGVTIDSDPAAYLHALILDTEYATEPGARDAAQLAAAVFARIRRADYGKLLLAVLADHSPSVVNDFIDYACEQDRAGCCQREDWCGEPVTRTYIRTDWPHYDDGDDRADVPFEVAHTCDRHPMGDGQDGRPDYGWRLA